MKVPMIEVLLRVSSNLMSNPSLRRDYITKFHKISPTLVRIGFLTLFPKWEEFVDHEVVSNHVPNMVRSMWVNVSREWICFFDIERVGTR